MVDYESFLDPYSYTSQLLNSYMKKCNWFDEEAFQNQSICVHQQYVKNPLKNCSDKSLSILIANNIIKHLRGQNTKIRDGCQVLSLPF
jgi:molybdopterin converting factor small subunit